MKYKNKSDGSEYLSKRGFLAASATVGLTSVGGCIEFLSSGNTTDERTPSSSQTASSTPTETGYQTETFHERPDDPYPGVLVLRGGGGPIDVEVFSDYAIDECQQFWNHTKYQLRDYYTSDIDTGEGADISIVLRHFPKPENKWSMFLPCAMMEVRVQKGIIAQGEFHNRLFENNFPNYSIRDVEIAASMVGADPDEVVKAGKERRRNYVIESDIEKAEDYDLEEPLRVVVGGDPVPENSAEAIEEAIEREL